MNDPNFPWQNYRADYRTKYRQNFPALADKSYFNYGGQGPMSRQALEAIYQAYEYLQTKGPFSGQVGMWIKEQTERTKQAIAQEINGPVDSITLTEDVTVGCNIPMWGLPWQAGDRLLISDCEHPGVVAIAQELGRRFQVGIDVCQLLPTVNGGDPVQVIADSLTPQTKLLVISHIFWNSGQVLPLGSVIKLCHERGVKVLVDAAQSVGMIPVDVTALNVDFYAFTGHKWWGGPEGLGALYVNPNLWETLAPTFIGWRGIITDQNAQPIRWQKGGKRYEIATSAYPLMFGLQRAIALQNEWGDIEERYQQILHLSHYLWSKLQKINHVQCLLNTAPTSGLVSFQLLDKKHHELLVTFLENQHNILLRTILYPSCVRACVNYFTTVEEIDQMLLRIEDFIADHYAGN